MKITFTIIALLSSLINYSQTAFNIENIGVSMSDLAINDFSDDESANILVIYEKGKSYFDESSFLLVTEIERKIKVLTPEGKKDVDIEIPLYKSGDKRKKIRDLKASTYNLVAGQIKKTKVSDDNIYTTEYSEHYNLVKFTFPNVQVGSVITYKYKIYSPFIFNLYTWDFEEAHPKLYSEYETLIPGNYRYNSRIIGLEAPNEIKNDVERGCIIIEGYGASDCVHQIYSRSNIKAFKQEAYMTSPNNFRSRIEYELREVVNFDGTVQD